MLKEKEYFSKSSPKVYLGVLIKIAAAKLLLCLVGEKSEK